MMIKSRVSLSVMPLTRVVRPLSGTSHYSTNRTALSFPVTGLLNLRHELATEVQLAVPKLGFSVQAVGLALPRPDQMYHLMTASDEKLCDEPAVTAHPRSLGAHEARHRLPEHVCERGLPLRRPHARDRKSTRLNSSHITISYAVFCLKKKTYSNASAYATQAVTGHAPARN